MRGAVHRILCIPRKLLETCRLRVRFCPAGIGRRLQRGGKQQKRRLAKSLTGHDCRDRHNSIGADYAESVHNSGITALVFATLRGSAPTSSISKPLRAIQRPAIGKASTAEPWAAARETSSVQESASSLEALIRWNEQEYEQSTSGPLRQANAVPAGVEQSSQAPKYPFGDA